MAFRKRPLLTAFRRSRRRLKHLFRPHRLQFVYSRQYQIELPGVLYDSQRGERILAFLASTGLLDPVAVHAAEPAPFRHLRRIHADDYLDSLNRPGALLTRLFGVELSEDLVERTLESQRTMVGGTIAATRLALASHGIGVNLGGGLHHAFADRGERFCAYNDVAAAIAELRSRGIGSRVMVVDLDLHDGDGTRSLFAADTTVHTFSIHNHTSIQIAAAAATVVELGDGVGDEVYLKAVRTHLPLAFERFRPELVVYLAGCDPALDDQIGDWKITAEALLERDCFVLSLVRAAGRRLPLVIVLGGGYGLSAWRYSARFLSSLLNRGRAIEPPSTEELLLARYRSFARELQVHELTGEAPRDEWGLSADDVFAALGGPRRARRFLGFYSKHGLELALERAGLIDRLHKLGFERLKLELDVDNPAGDTVRLYGDARRRELLIELRAAIDRRTIPGLALLRIEWLQLQNPRARFTTERPRLPGQDKPGLGMLQEIVTLLVLACDRLQLDGLIVVPAHYHVASHGRKTFRFLDPATEGLYRALHKRLEGLSLTAAVEALAAGRVVNTESGEPVTWKPAPMVFAVNDRLRQLVEGEAYESAVADAEARYQLVLAPPPPPHPNPPSHRHRPAR